jgi:hypothetical protein
MSRTRTPSSNFYFIGNRERGTGGREEGFKHSNIQTFEHSNIQTFLTSYLPLPLFSTSLTATPALAPHSHNSSAQKIGNREKVRGKSELFCYKRKLTPENGFLIQLTHLKKWRILS